MAHVGDPWNGRDSRMAIHLLAEVPMSRKSRDGQEERGHQVPPEGPEVFQPQRERPHALIPVRRLSDGERTYLSVRWPAGTARRGPVDPPVVPEVIRMSEKPLTRITYPDSYLDAERKDKGEDTA